MRALQAVTEGKPSVLFFPSSSDFPSVFSGKSCLTEMFLTIKQLPAQVASNGFFR